MTTKRIAVESWIRPRDAVVLLSPLLGSDRAAKEVLAERFKDGVLTASARFMTEANDVGPVPVVYTGPDAQSEHALDVTNADVVRGFPVVSATQMGSRFVYWESGRELKRVILDGAIPRYSLDWERDVDRWDWSTGTFLFSKPPLIRGRGATKHPARLRFPTRFVVYGVEFDAAAVERIALSFGTRPPPRINEKSLPPLCQRVPRGPSKGGRPKEAERWTNFWNQVTKLVVEDRLRKGFNSQAELRDELILMMGSGAFSIDAIKKPVREIWQVYVEPTRR